MTDLRPILKQIDTVLAECDAHQLPPLTVVDANLDAPPAPAPPTEPATPPRRRWFSRRR